MVRINLALQGGGAHGAFSWGVLDVLLQVPEIEIASVTGTSAGALNGAALKSGMALGSRSAALENLDWLWSKMGALSGGGFSDWLAGFEADAISQALEYSPGYVMTDLASRFFSPYAYGPFYAHPLRSLVGSFHFDRICSLEGPDLFVCATNVRTGKAKIFTGSQVTVDAILASACLPTVFQAVEITDPKTGVTDAYWDGGYTGNPALWPLFRADLPEDIVIVNINPIERAETPKTPAQIQSRMNEVSFNSSLLAELRAIAFVKRMLKDGTLAQGQMKDVHVHMIADDSLMNDLSAATKMVPIPSILGRLKEAGQRAAIAFLDQNFDRLGRESSVDLPALYG
ncbi:patatin-like phospholipase family protein [Cognatishimia sp.]|uniref:patatin-like phospholipase family protein n=1 Tax=Cognatishimia sp. TaxID=2211648 RepID=UPI0035144BBC